MSLFKKATKAKARLRLAISGPSGAGKTYTALTLAKHLGKRVAVIDTERGSASKYAGDVADFDSMELDMFTVENYIRAIKGAAAEGYDVLVIDSMSHAWSGRGGILEQADKMGGKFSAWAKLTPLQQSFIDSILAYPGHVIVTMRSKMAYEVSVEEGKNGTKQTKVEKMGLAPVQRDDVSYEFDVMLDMNDRNVATVVKTRCSAISGQTISKPDGELAATLLAWLDDGVEVTQARPTTAETTHQTQTPSTGDGASSAIHADRDAAVAAAAAQGFVPDSDASALAELLDVRLVQCSTVEQFADVAWDLAILVGVPSARPEWKRFSESCGDREVVWRDAVALAKSRAQKVAS